MKKFILLLAILGACIFNAAADSAPSFPGGDKALAEYFASNIKYPAAALDNGIEGVVNVAVSIKSDGSIGSIKIVRMIDPDLEQEAIRVIKNMPAWIPAQKNGAPAEEVVMIPIKFTLPEE